MDHPPFEGNVGRTPKKITESEHSRAQWFNPAQQCQVPALHGNSTSDVREKQANPGKIPHAKKYQSFSSSVEKKNQNSKIYLKALHGKVSREEEEEQHKAGENSPGVSSQTNTDTKSSCSPYWEMFIQRTGQSQQLQWHSESFRP